MQKREQNFLRQRKDPKFLEEAVGTFHWIRFISIPMIPRKIITRRQKLRIHPQSLIQNYPAFMEQMWPATNLLGHKPKGRNLQMDLIPKLILAVLLLLRINRIHPKERKKTLWKKTSGLWGCGQGRWIPTLSSTIKSREFSKGRWVNL